MMERYDADGETSVNNKHEANEEEKRSITEEAVTVHPVKVGPPVAAKPTPFPRNAKW